MADQKENVVTLSVDLHPTDDAVVLSTNAPFQRINLNEDDALRVANAILVRSIELRDRQRATRDALEQVNARARTPGAQAGLFPGAEGPYKTGA